MSDSEKMIKVEVAYALPDKQKVLALAVPEGTSAYEAVVRSGIKGHFDGLDIDAAPMGVFSQALGSKGMPSAKEYVLAEGDRVELYRPLIVDPKEMRKQRAEQAKQKRSD